MCAGSSVNVNSMVQGAKTMTSWEWDVSPQNKASGSVFVVDSGAAENVLPAGVCNHVKLSATRRSEAGIGFRGAGGERIRNHGQSNVKVHDRLACGGKHMSCGGLEETAHVSGPDGRSRELCARRQQGSQGRVMSFF